MEIGVHKAPVGRIAQRVEIDGHMVLSDVDQATGGDNLGPDPHDLLDAALGACTALTLKLFAQRKGWPLENADVRIRHEESPGCYQLFREVTLLGPLDEEQRARLLEIANKCPIHRILKGEILIETRLVD